MYLVRSVNGVPVRLTEERWKHITSRHPEMVGQHACVLATLAEPDLVQLGDRGELLAVRWWEGSSLGDKHLVVVYREIGVDDGFVLTAYFTNRPSPSRDIVWTS